MGCCWLLRREADTLSQLGAACWLADIRKARRHYSVKRSTAPPAALGAAALHAKEACCKGMEEKGPVQMQQKQLYVCFPQGMNVL